MDIWEWVSYGKIQCLHVNAPEIAPTEVVLVTRRHSIAHAQAE